MSKLFSQTARITYACIPDKQEGEEIDARVSWLSTIDAIASDQQPFSQVLLNLETLRVLQHCGLPSCGTSLRFGWYAILTNLQVSYLWGLKDRSPSAAFVQLFRSVSTVDSFRLWLCLITLFLVNQAQRIA